MQQETYTWGIIHEDGTLTREYDHEEGLGFPDTSGQHVIGVHLSGKVAHRVLLPEGASPVFFRRRAIGLDANAHECARATAHCIGWKLPDKKGVYLFVFEDGSTLLTDDLQAV